jgi:hypothetical protein
MFTMKSLRMPIVSFLAAFFLAGAAFAAEASPAGVWKWTVQGRQGGQGFEQTLKLDYKEGKLTGTMLGRQGGQFTVPDTEISDPTFKNGQIQFSITREFNGTKFTTKYDGKLEGDSIKGSFERTINGAPVKSEWDAKRMK